MHSTVSVEPSNVLLCNGHRTGTRLDTPPSPTSKRKIRAILFQKFMELKGAVAPSGQQGNITGSDPCVPQQQQRIPFCRLHQSNPFSEGVGPPNTLGRYCDSTCFLFTPNGFSLTPPNVINNNANPSPYTATTGPLTVKTQYIVTTKTSMPNVTMYRSTLAAASTLPSSSTWPLAMATEAGAATDKNLEIKSADKTCSKSSLVSISTQSSSMDSSTQSSSSSGVSASVPPTVIRSRVCKSVATKYGKGKRHRLHTKIRAVCWLQLLAVLLSTLVMVLGTSTFISYYEGKDNEKSLYYYLSFFSPIPFCAALCANIIGCSEVVKTRRGNFKVYVISLWAMAVMFLTVNFLELYCVFKLYAQRTCQEPKCKITITVFCVLWGSSNVLWIMLPSWSLKQYLKQRKSQCRKRPTVICRAPIDSIVSVGDNVM